MTARSELARLLAGLSLLAMCKVRSTGAAVTALALCTVSLLLWVVAHEARRRRALALSDLERRVMLVVARRRVTTASDLARALGLTFEQVVTTVRTLERLELVAHVTHEKFEGIVTYYLTRHGFAWERTQAEMTKETRPMPTKCAPLTHQWTSRPHVDPMTGLNDVCANCGAGRFEEARVYELEQAVTTARDLVGSAATVIQSFRPLVKAAKGLLDYPGQPHACPGSHCATCAPREELARAYEAIADMVADADAEDRAAEPG